MSLAICPAPATTARPTSVTTLSLVGTNPSPQSSPPIWQKNNGAPSFQVPLASRLSSTASPQHCHGIDIEADFWRQKSQTPSKNTARRSDLRGFSWRATRHLQFPHDSGHDRLHTFAGERLPEVLAHLPRQPDLQHLLTQTPTLRSESGAPKKEPAMGGTDSGNRATATVMWSVPAIFPIVGSNPFHPAPGK